METDDIYELPLSYGRDILVAFAIWQNTIRKYLAIHFHLGEHFLLVVKTMLSKPATPAVTSTLATKETLEVVLVAGIGMETCLHLAEKGGSCLSDSKVSHSIDLEMQSFISWDDESKI